MSFSEIGILVIAIFAFSYIMYQSSGLIDEFEKKQEELNGIKEKLKLGEITLDVAKSLLKKINKPMFTFAAAEDLSFSCCELTKEGASCQDVVDVNDCASGLHEFTDCDSTSVCRKGCCVDTSIGTYDKNVVYKDCTGTNSEWYDDANCNVPGVEYGCCVIADRTYFTTQQNCIYRTGQEGSGLNVDWQDLNEAQCVLLSSVIEEGACVLDEGCEFGTHQECVGRGEFHEGYLCSSPELNTGCERTDETTCVDGKDGVYFVDSCGNRANIYDADKINDGSYWDRVVDVEDSCGASSENGNADSKDCGNCNRFLGGICASALEDSFDVDEGDFYCRDTSCMFDGEHYKNGESWCVYDGKIDDGDDIVGSRHWKYVCNQGEIQVEPCADYRNQICIQSNTFDVSGEEVEFRNANCIANNWRECLDLNSEEGGLERCEDTLNCRIEEVHIGDSFSFDICTPRYPGAFHLTNENEQKVAEQICGMATQTCTVIYEETLTGSCECVENCACETTVFTQKMNDFCRKMGDCGLEVNVEGEYTENYKVKNAPKLSSNWISGLVAMANPVSGQFAEVEMEQYEEYLVAAGLLDLGDEGDGEGGGSGGSDLAMKAGMGVAGISAAVYAIAMYGPYEIVSSVSIALTGGTEAIAGTIGFASAGIAFGIGMVAGAIIADNMGLSPLGSIMMAVGGGILAVGVASYFVNIVVFGWTPIGWAWIAIGAAIMLMSLLFGGSDCEPVEVTYTCEPWQPPTGTDDCSKCNDDPLKPCSQYRCESLGAGCEFINEGTDQEMCTAAEDDGGYPQVEPSLGDISDGEIYDDISGNGFSITDLNGGCVEANKDLVFGLKTNEPAQCRFDIEQKEFDEMSFNFGINAYTYNHFTSFPLPDPSHGQSRGLDWSGDLTLYIKCRDRFGHETPTFYKVEMCVNEGEDVTPPLVKEQTLNPANDALVSYDSTEKDIEFHTNEAADCRWSEEDKDYDLMENDFTCDSDSFDDCPYLCSGTLPLTSSENVFYIRCKDQPWLDVVDLGDERNKNQQSYVYILRKPESKIAIDWVEPSGDLEVGTRISTVYLKVKTSGGGEYHKCKYSFSGYENMILFNDFDFDSTSEQTFNQMTTGRHKIYVECLDETGDSVQDETSFKVIYDSSSPQVARVYLSSGKLKLITTENAECAYSTDDCTYDFDVADSMSGDELMHELNAEEGNTYYIKCKDEHGLVPGSGGCSIIVRDVSFD